MAPNELGPFRPGPGMRPPHLAGRDMEQGRLRALLTELAEGNPAGPILLLHGPRGNGKTVLLDWVEGEAASAGIEAAVLQPPETPDPARLAESLTPRSWRDRLAASELTAVELAGLSWRPGSAGTPQARDILLARASGGALVLLVDEAHTLQLDAGRALLNGAQEVGRRRPLLLVLAGTPHLEAHLNRMGASFWSRAQQIRVGRLGAEATSEAFRRPFATAGIPVDREALAGMVRESQRYPYFVQLLGSEVWRCAVQSERREVTGAAFRAALRDFRRIRGSYYRQRFNELKRHRLLPAARSVAEAFRSQDTLDEGALDGAIAAALGREPDAPVVRNAADKLNQLGYVWQLEDRPMWEPGIPSLMDYVREYAPRAIGR